MDDKKITSGRKIFPGWYICLAGAFMAMCGGAVTVMGYYVNGQLVNEGLLDSTTAGNCTSIVSLCSVLFAAAIGGLIKKKGLKLVTIISLILSCVCLAVLSFAPVNDILWMVCTFVFGTTLVVTSKLGAPILVNTWFQYNKAIPMAIVIAAASAVTAFFSGLQSRCYTQYGRLGGYGVIFAICVVGIVLALFFVRQDIHEMGEVRDGRAYRLRKNLSMDDSDTAAANVTVDADSKRGLLRNGKFWFFSLACLMRMGVYAGSSAYVTFIILSRGFSSAQAAASIAFLAMSSTIGRLTTPVVTKVLRLSNTAANVLAHVMMFAAGLLIYFSSSLTLFSVAIILVGYAYGLGFVSQTLVLPDLFPQYDFNVEIGLFSTVIGCSFIFPSLYGYVGKLLGENYSPIYLVLGILNLALGIGVFLMRPKKRAAKQA